MWPSPLVASILDGEQQNQQGSRLQFGQKETLSVIVSHCSAYCGKPGGRGDDERQQAECVTQDFGVVGLEERFQFVRR